MNNKMKTVLIGIVLVLSLVAAGCAGQDEGTAEEETFEPVQVRLGDPGWDDSRANTQVFKQIIESTGEYEIEIVKADVGAIYQGVSQGDLDAYISAWLPLTQAPYVEKYGDDLDYVGNISSGARCGLVVPSYVTIDSIDELADHSEEFNGEIQGIEPGAGIMQNCEGAIETYGLDYQLNAASTPAMATVLQDAIDNEEWIVVTLWTPHWTFGRMDLKYLDDPEMTFGEAENLAIIARADLSEEKPELHALMANFHMDISDVAAIMVDIDAGMTPEEAAAAWLEAHPEKYDEVLGTA
ncbi:MAG: glycine betaine ABC transporter substrate-binding protein [Methanosarcinaceae archaeon]|nr:glycine betaine ABC transporter substrate-binding protein [Methanosarcinaceae archaeon]